MMIAPFNLDDSLLLDMPDLVKPEYSKREVVEAGKALAGHIPDVTEEALRVFRIAHNWRAAHVQPMRKIRRELATATKRVQSDGITAARLKRMKSIRKKLRNTNYTLYQMQDIAGCRAIVNSMDEVEKLIAFYKEGRSNHGFQHPYDYVAAPKRGGYRSFHLLLKFAGVGDDEIYNRQRIEVQLRTILQHAWATAVEAAGLVRNEDLKGGDGDGDWLRLFEIMSSEIAIEEGRPTVPGVSEQEYERRQELRHLDNKVNALKNLKIWNNAIRFTDQIQNSYSKFYLIQYDNETKRVTVEPFNQFMTSSGQLIQEEQSHPSRDTVLVEMDKAEDLKEAYPNYFLDVQIFNSRLKSALTGAKPPPLKGHVPTAPTPTEKIDLAWWWRRRR